MGATADLLVRVKGDTSDAQGKLKGLSGALGTAGKVAVGAAGAAAVAVGAIGVKGVMAFAGFDKGMREVFTLMPGISKDAMGKMEGDVLALSQKMGVATTDVVPALYQAISAGVPPDSVFEFMETASKAAIGGVTDLETATDGITSVVNAFGAETIGAAEASDLMFTAVKLGKTDMQQLSKSLFQVNPIAAGLGVQFGDVTASLAALTAQGVPTSVAATQVRQAMVEISKEGGKASDTFKSLSGKSFKDFIAGGGNMKQAFDIMKAGADEMGVGVNDLFGSVEAGNAVLALTSENGAAAFGDAMDEMQNSAGATQTAFNTMDGGLSRSWDKIKTTASNALIKIGQKLAPFVEKAVEWLADKLPGAIDWLIGAFEDMAPTIEKVAKWLGENIPKAVGFMIEAWKTIRPVVEAVFGFISGIIETFVGWFSGDASDDVGAGSEKIMGWWQQLVDFVGPIFESIVEVIQVAMDLILTIIDAVWTVVSAIWNEHGAAILSFVQETFLNIAAAIQGVMDVIKGIIDVVMGLITGDWGRVWDGIKGIVTGIWDTIKGVVSQAINTVKLTIRLVLDAIVAIWERIWDGISTFVSDIWDGITGFVTDKFNAVKDFLSDTLGGIKDFFSEKWGAIKEGVGTALGGIKNFVTDKFGAARDFLSDKMGNVKDFMSGGWRDVLSDTGEKFGSIHRTILDKMGEAVATVRRILGNIVGFFRDKFNEARDWVWKQMGKIPGIILDMLGKAGTAATDLGKAVVSGILGGLGGLASGLKDKLTGALSSAFRGVKNFFGIRSPSKVAAKQIGEPIAQGIIEPTEKLLSSMTGSMRSISASNLTSFTPTMGGEPLMVNVYIGEEQVAEVLAERMRRDYIDVDLDNDGWGVRT